MAKGGRAEASTKVPPASRVIFDGRFNFIGQLVVLNSAASRQCHFKISR